MKERGVALRRHVVAIDARRAVRRTTGIGRYVLELARRMPALAPDIDFWLIMDRPLSEKALPVQCRQVVIGPYMGEFSPVARLHSPLWLNLRVPPMLARCNVSLFHGTNFAIPLRSPCPCVATIHDLAFLRVPKAYGPVYRRYMSALVGRALRRASAVVTGSHAARQDLRDAFGSLAELVCVIHNGVDDEFFSRRGADDLALVRSSLRLPNRFVLHVGVVETRKNLGLLLRACAPILHDGLADEVILAGRDGLGAGRVREVAAGLGIDNRVRFLGYVRQETLPGLYALATAVVFPSRYEGFGLPILEGMASGVPVIASDSSSIPEVAGGSALLFPPDDVRALERALRMALTDDSLRRRLIAAGYERARGFRWSTTAERHVSLYREVLEARSRG